MNKQTTSKFVDTQIIVKAVRDNKQKVTMAAFLVELFRAKPDVTNDEILYHMKELWPLSGYADPSKVAGRAKEDRRKFNAGSVFTYQREIYGGEVPETLAVDPDAPVKTPKFKSVDQIDAEVERLKKLREALDDSNDTDA